MAKNHILIIPILFISLLGFSQDTLNVSVTLTNKLTLKKIENMNIVVYKRVDDDDIISETKETGADFILYEKNEYLFKVTESRANSEDYFKDHFTKELTGDHEFNFPIKPNIKKFYLGLDILDFDNKDTINTVDISILRGEIVEYINQNSEGIIDSVSLPTNSLLEIEVTHDFYEPKRISLYNNGDTTYQKKFIELTKKTFDKEIKIINAHSEKPITNVIVSFPEIKSLPNRILKDTTNSNGIAAFKNLPKGYQKIRIFPIEGYQNKLDDEYFVYVDDGSQIFKEKPIKLVPSIQDSITIKGTVLNEVSKPINGAKVTIRTNSGKSESNKTDENGEYKIVFYYDKVKEICEFSIEIKNENFAIYQSKNNEPITICDAETNLKEMIPISLNRTYQKYKISVNKTKSKINKITDIVFTESLNKNGFDEKGIKISYEYLKDKTIIEVTGPANFNKIRINYKNKKNKSKYYMIEENKKKKIENCIWKLKKKSKCKNTTPNKG